MSKTADAAIPEQQRQTESTILTDPHHTRADLVMLRQAIRRKWKIPDVAFEALPKMVANIAVDASQKTETRLKAVACLSAMHEQNDGERRKPEVTVNVGVGISVDERRSRIAEICRAAIERGGTGGTGSVVDGAAE